MDLDSTAIAYFAAGIGAGLRRRRKARVEAEQAN